MVSLVIVAEVALLAVGFLALYVGAEALVKGAASLAKAMGVTTVVVGLTVVAFVTSAPELVVGAVASFEGAQGIALGNVVGSNIANVGLILGVAAILRPMEVDPDHVTREVLVVLASAVVVWAMALDGVLSTLDGVLLLVGMVAFLVVSYRAARSGRHSVDRDDLPEEAHVQPSKDGKNAVLLAAGLVGVVVGAWLTVESGSALAARVGVGEVVVGLTVVAIGTSLPELATSAVASWRREIDISVGNVIGSNVFNTLAVLGVVAVIAPLRVDPGTLSIGIPVMLVFSIALIPLLRAGFKLDRWKGSVLLAGFVLFWVYVVVAGADWVAV